MENSKLNRINELARKQRSEAGLTEAEKAEQAQLRKEYLAEFRAAAIGVLENTYLQRPDGTKEKLKRKQ